MKKLFLFFQNIKNKIRQFKIEADKILNENSVFLESGVWRADKSLMVFYRKGFKKYAKKEKKNIFWAKLIDKGSDLSTRLARRLFAIFYKSNLFSGENFFNGQLIIISSARRTIRFVNIDEKKLLTKYSNKETMEKYNNNRSLWHEHFSTVPLYEVNYDLLYTIEKYIIKKFCSAKKKFNFIIHDYIKKSYNLDFYIENKRLNEKEKEYILQSCRKISIEKDGLMAIKIIESSDYKKCITHGDISTNNIIYDGKEFYYIDFENISKRIFFYDILGYLCKAKINDNCSAIENYLRGKYDSEFKKFFSKYGVDFCEDYRRAYIVVFALEDTKFDDREISHYRNLLNTLKN